MHRRSFGDHWRLTDAPAGRGPGPRAALQGLAMTGVGV